MRKTEIYQKTDKRTDLGTTFLAKTRILSDFGIPGRSLGKASGRILGGKFGGGEKVQKQIVRKVASATVADPGKEGFREDIRARWAKSNTPSLTGERWAGGLFALRVTRRGDLGIGGLEVWNQPICCIDDPFKVSGC